MSATTIPFPCRRRIGKARHAAWKYLHALDNRRGCAEPYWRQVAGNLRSSMEKAGIEPAVIDREVKEFQIIFVDEVRRLSSAPMADTGDCA